MKYLPSYDKFISMSSENNKLIVFLDTVGRTVLGVLVNEKDDVLEIKNPVILNLSHDPNNPGRMSVQLLPILFREFLAAKDEGITLFFKKSLITESNNPELDFQLQNQYQQLFGGNNVFIPPTGNNPSPSKNVVKLFDE